MQNKWKAKEAKKGVGLAIRVIARYIGVFGFDQANSENNFLVGFRIVQKQCRLRLYGSVRQGVSDDPQQLLAVCGEITFT